MASRDESVPVALPDHRLARMRAGALLLPVALVLPFVLGWPLPCAIALAGAALSLVLLAMGASPWPILQNACLAAASVAACLAAGEIGFWFSNHSGTALRLDAPLLDDGRFAWDPDLGYRPLPDQRIRAWRPARPQDSVTYTIGADGLRVTPAPPSASCSAVFVIDSFAFGWGLEDGATLPAQFVAASAGAYRAYNFSYSGYGPHQLLRALETGRVARAVGGKPVNLVVYIGLMDHMLRAAGRAFWDLEGPRYVIADDGHDLRYVGPFHSRLYARFDRILGRKSEIWRFLDRIALARARVESVEAVPLYIALLRKTQKEVERQYGAGSFLVLFWDSEDPTVYSPEVQEEVRRQLVRAGLQVIPISRILPDIAAHRLDYVLGADDSHPNALADRRIAAFLADRVAPRHCPAEGPVGTPAHKDL